MTVKELREALQWFSDDMELRALWDCTPNFPIHRIVPFNGYDGPVALIDCGSGEDGDWDSILRDIARGQFEPATDYQAEEARKALEEEQ